jgi:predicted secreted protein
VEYLAYGSMKRSSGRIDMTKLKNISGLSKIEEEAWQTCQKESSTLWRRRESDLAKASNQHDEMKRQLWREITDEIHYEFHPEKTKTCETTTTS